MLDNSKCYGGKKLRQINRQELLGVRKSYILEMAKEDLTDEVSGNLNKVRMAAIRMPGESVPDKGNSICKGPGVEHA